MYKLIATLALALLLAIPLRAPADAPATQPALSSKPVVKDGLQLTVTLPKATFTAAEPLKFTVEFKNVSKKPLTLYNAKWYWAWQTRFLQLPAAGPWQLHETFIGMRGPLPTTDTLEPNATLTVPVAIDPAQKFFEYLWQGEQQKSIPPLRQLNPGKYRLTIAITLDENPFSDELIDYWTGTITTAPLDFEITAPTTPSTQAAATVTTTQFLGAENQWPACLITCTDIEGLHGGMALQIAGTGQGLIRLVTPFTEKAFRLSLTPAESLALRKVLLDADFLAAPIKERPGIPGEVRPTITLRNAAGQERQLAKWRNDKVPGFDPVYAALLDLKKKTESAKPEYDGKCRGVNWPFPAPQTTLASKPVVNGALQVTVTLPQPTFPATAQPRFTVQFKNISDKPLTLNEPEFFWPWVIRFEDVKQHGPWQLRLTPMGMLHLQQSTRAQSTRTCQPGETLDVLVNLNAKGLPFEFVWQGDQAEPVPPQPKLAPGQYQLTINITLAQGGKPGVTYWTGQLKTEPITFEITPAGPTTQP